MIATLASGLAIAISVHVDGAGYLRFVRDGRIVYAASATLTIQDGVLGSKGLPLTPAIRISTGVPAVDIDPAGNVRAGSTTCGRLLLARFEVPLANDKGWFVAAARATVGYAGDKGFGEIRVASATDNVQQQAAARIIVQRATEVETETVTLGQVAAIQADPQTRQVLEAIALCTAPAIGIDMPVTAARIQAFAKRAGVEAIISVPPGAVIRHKSQAIKQEDFVAAAIRAGQESLGADLPMTCHDSPGEFKAPSGKPELKAEGITTSGATMAVTMGIYIDGKRINSRTVNLRIDASAEIKAGANVKIVMKSSGLSVEMPGKTRTGGLIGQSVTVVTDTGSVLTGIVVGADRVEVKI